MPQSYSEPIQNRFPFEYMSLTRLRAEGITAATVPDDRALRLIRALSSEVNNVTRQWFIPLDAEERISAHNGSLLRHASNIPFLEVRTVTTDYSGSFSLGLSTIGAGGTQLVPDQDYRVDHRKLVLLNHYLRLFGPRVRTRRAEWTRGYRNFIVDGVFGWLEDRPPGGSVSTTTTSDVTVTSTQITVSDSSGFQVDDIALVKDESLQGHFILNGTGANALNIDAPALLRKTIPSGATVTTYGKVPQNVSMATIILLRRFKNLIGSDEFVSGSNTDRLIKERTDNYFYELEKLNSSGGGGGGGGSSSTGSRDADRLLESYVAPPIMTAV